MEVAIQKPDRFVPDFTNIEDMQNWFTNTYSSNSIEGAAIRDHYFKTMNYMLDQYLKSISTAPVHIKLENVFDERNSINSEDFRLLAHLQPTEDHKIIPESEYKYILDEIEQKVRPNPLKWSSFRIAKHMGNEDGYSLEITKFNDTTPKNFIQYAQDIKRIAGAYDWINSAVKSRSNQIKQGLDKILESEKPEFL